jgi:hypothetical protein
MEFMSASAVARELGLSRGYVWKLAKEGLLPIAATIRQPERSEAVFSPVAVSRLKHERAKRAA